jgi:hypothetical protein
MNKPLAFLLVVLPAAISAQQGIVWYDADRSFVEGKNTFKLAYALNWQAITIGTFFERVKSPTARQLATAVFRYRSISAIRGRVASIRS